MMLRSEIKLEGRRRRGLLLGKLATTARTEALLPKKWLNIACGWEAENNFFSFCFCAAFAFLTLNGSYLKLPNVFFFPISFTPTSSCQGGGVRERLRSAQLLSVFNHNNALAIRRWHIIFYILTVKYVAPSLSTHYSILSLKTNSSAPHSISTVTLVPNLSFAKITVFMLPCKMHR